MAIAIPQVPKVTCLNCRYLPIHHLEPNRYAQPMLPNAVLKTIRLTQCVCTDIMRFILNSILLTVAAIASVAMAGPQVTGPTCVEQAAPCGLNGLIDCCAGLACTGEELGILGVGQPLLQPAYCLLELTWNTPYRPASPQLDKCQRELLAGVPD